MIAQRVVDASERLWQLLALGFSALLAVILGMVFWTQPYNDNSPLALAVHSLFSGLMADHVRRFHPQFVAAVAQIHERVRTSSTPNVLLKLLASGVELTVCFVMLSSLVALTASPLFAAASLPHFTSSDKDKVLATLGSAALALLIHFVIWTSRFGLTKPPLDNTLRGSRLTKFDTARQRMTNDAPLSVPWGGLSLAVNSTLAHFALLGNTRSGKSTNLRLLMQAVLPEIQHASVGAGRAIVYDPKTEYVPIIVGAGVPESSLRNLHPFDARSWAWHLAADIQSPTDAWSLASVVIATPPNEHDPFYPDAARDVLSAGILGLHLLAPGRWRFRDLLLMFRHPGRVEQILKRSEHTCHVLELYGGDPRTLGNVTATLRKHLAPFEPIAACWEHCGERWMSLGDWVATHTVLVLGYDESAEEPISVINAALLQRLSELLLSPASRPAAGRSWVILDECREIRRIDKLPRFC